MESNYDNILRIIEEQGIVSVEITHPESHSCEESKRYRSERALEGLGSKNIVFHCKGRFHLVTTYGGKSIKARNFKHEFGSKDIRFATQDEIDGVIGSKIGSIPPFGFGNADIPIYVDEEIFVEEYFIFNPSTPTRSIRIRSEDLRKIYGSIPNPVKYFRQCEDAFEIFIDADT